MNGRILIVDDESNFVEILKANLEREGYATDAAYDGEEAYRKICNQTEDYDLVLLDCMLPLKNGFDVCRDVRNAKIDVPIIMVSARGEEIDKVLGLELGADDYITKPFGIREVIARVNAHLRRRSQNNSRAPEVDKVLHLGDLAIDKEALEIRRNGEIIPLTLREFELVCFLASNPGQIFSRETLLEKVWGFEYFGDVRTVDVTIRRTREKLEPDQSSFRYILTKRGVGYYFSRDLK